MIRKVLVRVGATVSVALALALVLVSPAAAHFGGGERPQGVWVAELTGTPEGLTAHMLQGSVPGFFVQVPAGTELLVCGADGAVLAEVGQAQGPAQGSWLDERLKLPAGPPEHDHGEAAVSWRIPAELDGRPVEFTGATRWVPNTDPESLRAEAEHDGTSGQVGTAVAGVALAGALGYYLLRRRRAKETQ